MANIIIPVEGLTLTLNGVVCNDLSDGDAITISFPNDKTSHTNGLNGNTIIKDRLNGDVCEVSFNVIRYSDFDIFMNTESEKSIATLFDGSIQRNYVKDGTNGVERVDLVGGSIIKKPDDTINTQDGEELVNYSIRFRSGKRVK